jgi:hypothetical protein
MDSGAEPARVSQLENLSSGMSKAREEEWSPISKDAQRLGVVSAISLPALHISNSSKGASRLLGISGRGEVNTDEIGGRHRMNISDVISAGRGSTG